MVGAAAPIEPGERLSDLAVRDSLDRFALFWERAALTTGLEGGGSDTAIKYTFGIFMPLFGLPFVLVGLAMLAVPLLGLFGKRPPIVHALTDRRLMTFRGGRWQRLRSVLIDRIRPVESKAGGDGWGSIAVQTHSRIDGEGDRVTQKFAMSGIPDVARVERLILEQQKH